MRLRVLDDGLSAPGQGSLAVAAGGRRPHRAGAWMLLNPTAAAAARAQLESEVDDKSPRRAAPSHAVVLTDARLDQVAGLIGLRGSRPIDLYATPAVFEDLTTTVPVLPQLQRHCEVHWHLVPVAGDQRQAQFAVRGHEGLALTAWDLGRTPAACMGSEGPAQTGRCVALGLHEPARGKRALYLRGLPAEGSGIEAALQDLDCVLLEPGEPLDAPSTRWMQALPAVRKYLLGVPHPLAPQGLQPLAAGDEILI